MMLAISWDALVRACVSIDERPASSDMQAVTEPSDWASWAYEVVCDSWVYSVFRNRFPNPQRYDE